MIQLLSICHRYGARVASGNVHMRLMGQGFESLLSQLRRGFVARLSAFLFPPLAVFQPT
jgi:hypothetical protein